MIAVRCLSFLLSYTTSHPTTSAEEMWCGYLFFLFYLVHASKRPIDAKSTSKSSSRSFPLVVNLDTISATPYSQYSKLMHLTMPEYRQYAAAPAGREHYALLSYFSQLLSATHQSYIDIGTRFATSALTLASSGHPVVTFDIPQSKELEYVFAANKMNKQQWFDEISQQNCSIIVKNEDLLTLPDEEFDLIRRSPLILLDTFHRPYTKPFEREFLSRLTLAKYNGLLLLDDISENDEMKKWWREIVCSKYHSFRIYDLTIVGHATGTGLLDFSHRVQIIGKEKEAERALVNPQDPKFQCDP
jgi:hypothetical protein